MSGFGDIIRSFLRNLRREKKEFDDEVEELSKETREIVEEVIPAFHQGAEPERFPGEL